jgi:hypothetical protein
VIGELLLDVHGPLSQPLDHAKVGDGIGGQGAGPGCATRDLTRIATAE